MRTLASAFVTALLLAGLATAQTSVSPVPVVLSTDVGNEIDDQWAIVYLLTNPRFDVKGLISAHAPSISPPAGHNSYLLLRSIVEQRLHMVTHPPVIEGADEPLANDHEPRRSAGAQFLVEVSKPYSATDRLTVLVIGAATDLASALMIEPVIADRIQVVQMGFKNWPAGAREYNIENDVLAAQLLLKSNVPLTVGSGDVCQEYLTLKFDEAKKMLADQGAIGQWLWSDYLAWYYRFVKPLRVNDFSKGWVIWDIITLANVLHMAKSETYPRPVLQTSLSMAPGKDGRKIEWITSVDSEALWKDFLDRLTVYRRTHAIE